MPVYPIKNKKTGETFNMPWDKEGKPTALDVKLFLAQQEETQGDDSLIGKIKGVASSAWDKINKPLIDVTPEMRQHMGEFTQQHPVMGKIGELATDALTSQTSPLSIGLGATGVLASGASKIPAITNAARGIGKTASAGLVGHGLYNAYEQPTIGGKIGGGLEALGGMAGYKHFNIAPDAMPVAKPNIIPKREPLGLPPAPPEVLNKPTFIAGEKGVVPNRPIPNVLDGDILGEVNPEAIANGVTGPLKPNVTQAPPVSVNLDELREANRLKDVFYTQAGQNPGGSIDIPSNTSELPPPNASERYGFNRQNGGSTGNTILDTVPNRLRPRAVQSQISQRVPEQIRSGPSGYVPPDSDINFVSGGPEVTPDSFNINTNTKPDVNIGSLNSPYELPSAKRSPTLRQAPKQTAGGPIPQAIKNGAAKPNNIGENLYREIPKDASVLEAVRQWAYGLEGSKIKGNIARKSLPADLNDPSLVAKFETGNREGSLGVLQKTLDDLHSKGTTAGIFKADQKVRNYLHHAFDANEDEVSAALKNYVAKNPGIAKTRKFPTYEIAKSEGLKPKYNTIPEIHEAYVTKLNKAVRNKEFYDYLVNTKQMDPSETLSSSPNNWTFKGKNAEELKRLVGNVLGESPKGLNKLAKGVAWTKNLYLGSGIPGTPLNAHDYNIMRSNIMARGVKKGLGDFFSGVFNPSRDTAEIAKHESSGFLGDLVDRGMTWTSIEDHNALPRDSVNAESAAKSLGGKAMQMQQKLFEDPLFKRHLPAVKLRIAEDVFKGNLEKLGREKALKVAATAANDFAGGINKSLRNKTYSDLSRIGLLAPDWLESRANLAAKGAKALAGKENPVYGKALKRAAGMRLAGAGATAGLTGAFVNSSKRPTNSTSIPAGSSDDKNRQIPIYGSAAEGLNLPEQLLSGRDLGEVVSSRFSQPSRVALNTILNRDDFGNPLRGNDKYGRDIGKIQGMKNQIGQIGNIVTPPYLVALIQYLNGKVGGEQALTQGLELPWKINSEPSDRNDRSSRSGPRLRLR